MPKREDEYWLRQIEVLSLLNLTIKPTFATLAFDSQSR